MLSRLCFTLRCHSEKSSLITLFKIVPTFNSLTLSFVFFESLTAYSYQKLHLIHTCVFCVPALEYLPCEEGDVTCFAHHLNPSSSDGVFTYSRCSTSICWINKCMNKWGFFFARTSLPTWLLCLKTWDVIPKVMRSNWRILSRDWHDQACILESWFCRLWGGWEEGFWSNPGNKLWKWNRNFEMMKERKMFFEEVFSWWNQQVT